MRLAAPLVVLLIALAGCSGGGGGEPDGPDPVPPLAATPTTGVIRAIVIDEAVRPLANVTVAVETAGAEPQVVKTNQEGFAGFEGLAPGDYLVTASRLGYITARQSATVVANVNDPPVTKLLLTADPVNAPYFVERQYEGFMQCAVGAAGGSANVCFIANFYPCLVQETAGQPCTGNLTSDFSYFEVPNILEQQRIPDWVQAELVWESTQSLSPELLLRMDIVGDSGIEYVNTTGGASPVFATFNRTEAEEYELGTRTGLALEAFTSSDTVGATVNQKITYFVHAFYGYTPPPGWRFSDASSVPTPA